MSYSPNGATSFQVRQASTERGKENVKNNRELKTKLTQGREPLRLVALSDGLFATVLTLLVLDLRIPDALNAYGGSMTDFSKWVGPHLFSYLLTFLVAGTYWLAHHRNFDHIVRYDRGLLGYNLLFLLFIGLLPFSTATLGLLGFNSSASATYAANIWAIYAANIILAGITLNLTWNYAVSHRLVTAETTERQSRNITIHQIVTPAVFLISIVAQYIFPRVFLGPFTLLLIPLALWGVDRYLADAEQENPITAPDWSERFWRAGSMILWLLMIGLAVWAMSS
jgi:uncharacterized membrane protein